MRRRSTLLVVLAAVLLLPAGGAARAEVCTGAPVLVGTAPDAPLRAAVAIRVRSDCPERSYDLTVTPYLNVGRVRVARLDDLTATAVGTQTQRLTLRVPARVVAAARRRGRRGGHRRAVLKLVARATDRSAPGEPYRFARDAFLRLPR